MDLFDGLPSDLSLGKLETNQSTLFNHTVLLNCPHCLSTIPLTLNESSYVKCSECKNSFFANLIVDDDVLNNYRPKLKGLKFIDFLNNDNGMLQWTVWDKYRGKDLLVSVFPEFLFKNESHKSTFINNLRKHLRIQAPATPQILDLQECDNYLYTLSEANASTSLTKWLGHSHLSPNESWVIFNALSAHIENLHSKKITGLKYCNENITLTEITGSTTNLETTVILREKRYQIGINSLIPIHISPDTTVINDCNQMEQNMSPFPLNSINKYKTTFTYESDLYQIGSLLFEWMSLQPLYSGSPSSIISQKKAKQHPQLREYNPLLPKYVEPVLDKLIGNPPKKRFRKIKELRQLLTGLNKKYNLVEKRNEGFSHFFQRNFNPFRTR